MSKPHKSFLSFGMRPSIGNKHNTRYIIYQNATILKWIHLLSAPNRYHSDDRSLGNNDPKPQIFSNKLRTKTKPFANFGENQRIQTCTPREKLSERIYRAQNLPKHWQVMTEFHMNPTGISKTSANWTRRDNNKYINKAEK